MGALDAIPNTIMVLGMAAFIGAAFLIAMTQMGNLSIASGTANTSIQAAITAIGGLFSSWYSLLVTIIVVGIIITVMYFSFAGRGRR